MYKPTLQVMITNVNKDQRDRPRVVPKDETTKTSRRKAKRSSTKFYSELMRRFSDIALACDTCMLIDEGRCTLSASVSRDFHECQKNRFVVFAKAKDEIGIVVRSRPPNFKPTGSSTICKYMMNRMGCYEKENCQFPHSQLESSLWKRDFEHEISILSFMQDLDRSYLRAEHIVDKVINTFSGEFILLCKGCYRPNNDEGSSEECRKCRHLPVCKR